ncbi:hypothetical protein O181_005357 [Austropuccinia psidii MF-1]|uniref:Uncharacterized protein n=1 Tax=Austropuccinia psidii MF-1 TaxID=1389203 RepID=A0A9Q3GGL5_9BASI|nr:hypothetical protein [Austropuccinia psidii MF-1]
MEKDRRKNFRFSKWVPESLTTDTNQSGPETENPIIRISSSELDSEFLNSFIKMYSKNKQFGILLQIFQNNIQNPTTVMPARKPWFRDNKANKPFLEDGLLHHMEKNTSSLRVIDRDNISLILQEYHDRP